MSKIPATTVLIMKQELSGRTHTAKGVSLPNDVAERVEKRLESLRPRVKGFSHYVLMLVDWDLRRAEKHPATRDDDLPFEDAQLPLFGRLAA